MVIHSQQKQRALNIIWNAAADYTVKSEFEGYDAEGRADLYWNYIIGAVHRHCDFARLQSYFDRVRPDPNRPFYEGLAWIGLENYAFAKSRDERPVLESLRQAYAESVLAGRRPEAFYYLIDEISKAHFARALGQNPPVRDQVAALLEMLEFDAAATTEEIVLRLNQVVDQHFPLAQDRKKSPLFHIDLPFRFNLPLKKKHPGGLQNPFLDISLLNLFNTAASTPGEEPAETDKKAKHSRKSLSWEAIKEQQESKARETIQARYGLSMLSEAQTRALEQQLCTGNHKDCRLHFTRGEFAAQTESDHRKAVLKQREKNRQHFKENLARNHNSILKLTNIIKNTLLIHFEPSTYRSESGQLVSGRVWRNLHLNDNRVFLKSTRDDIGSLSVDLLLDASGSQIDRQEMLASQGYIIAESLQRCQIPVRVFSFCTNSNFTVINLFRNYDETSKNDAVFNYRASGCNRDGLAIRTVLHLIEKTHYDHRILIVLSDGKPVDPHGIGGNRTDPDLNFYADTVGVNDAALEVRRGRLNGISILCVFTGLDEDIPAAQKIYGNDLVFIKSPEKFADIVGVLLKNELRNI